jgi:hypothetical protein
LFQFGHCIIMYVWSGISCVSQSCSLFCYNWNLRCHVKRRQVNLETSVLRVACCGCGVLLYGHERRTSVVRVRHSLRIPVYHVSHSFTFGVVEYVSSLRVCHFPFSYWILTLAKYFIPASWELSSPARTLGSWLRIPLKAWAFVCTYSVFV